MSCSKPLPPFVCDLLYYLNRDQLERFSIISRPLKNFIERYFHSKPYRLFDQLKIFAGWSMRIVLFHNDVRWHPNRADYSAQQFLAGQYCESIGHFKYHSFAEMRPYLVPTVRIRKTHINVDRTYNPEQTTEMESIAYLWSGYKIEIGTDFFSSIDANDLLPILNSTTILQCRLLEMKNAHFPFKDYKVLYTVKIIELSYVIIDIDPNYWADFFEQPVVKPLVVLRSYNREKIDNLLDRLKEAFSIAVVPNAFKLVFVNLYFPLTKFREANKISGEILELKQGHPVEYQEEDWAEYCFIYTLERSNI